MAWIDHAKGKAGPCTLCAVFALAFCHGSIFAQPSVVPSPSEKNLFHIEIPNSGSMHPDVQLLQALREQERHLLQYCVPESVHVQEVRARIRTQEGLVRSKNITPPTGVATQPILPMPVGNQILEIKVKVEMPEIKMPSPPERVIETKTYVPAPPTKTENVLRIEMPNQGAETSRGVPSEETLLLSLRDQERVLLEDFGPDYFRVKNLRARIQAVEKALTEKQARQATSVPVAPALGRELQHLLSFLPCFAEKPGHRNMIIQAHFPPPPPPPEKMVSPHKPPEAMAEIEQEEKAAPGQTLRNGPLESTGHVAAENPLWSLTLLHVAAVAIGLFLGLLLHLLLIWCLIRNLGSKLASHFRLELVGAQPNLEPAAPTHVPELLATATKFDMGPSYEDELNRQNQEAEQKEAATLQELFQQNVSLRQKMNELDL